jgi:hypothetical protein
VRGRRPNLASISAGSFNCRRDWICRSTHRNMPWTPWVKASAIFPIREEEILPFNDLARSSSWWMNLVISAVFSLARIRTLGISFSRGTMSMLSRLDMSILIRDRESCITWTRPSTRLSRPVSATSSSALTMNVTAGYMPLSSTSIWTLSSKVQVEVEDSRQLSRA